VQQHDGAVIRAGLAVEDVDAADGSGTGPVRLADSILSIL
jgi:hypothetical protein